MDETKALLEELRKRIEALEQKQVPEQASVPVTSSPTLNGYVPVEWNGRRIKIATVS